jgi:hypothetical protein
MIIYLYVKTHNKTGLKYLGKTTSTNPHKYRGSGLYWANHLKIHGVYYTTEIIKECYSKDELKRWGLYYSELWDVTNSNEWANLRIENGDGGSQKGGKRSELTKEKFRNKIWTEKAIESRLANCLKSAALRKGKKNPLHGLKIKGRTQTAESNTKRSLALKGRKTSTGTLGHKFSEETKQKMAEAQKNQPIQICPHCGKGMRGGSYNRWHGENCKLNIV